MDDAAGRSSSRSGPTDLVKVVREDETETTGVVAIGGDRSTRIDGLDLGVVGQAHRFAVQRPIPGARADQPRPDGPPLTTGAFDRARRSEHRPRRHSGRRQGGHRGRAARGSWSAAPRARAHAGATLVVKSDAGDVADPGRPARLINSKKEKPCIAEQLDGFRRRLRPGVPDDVDAAPEAVGYDASS
jgi:hypothetical protein